MEKFRYAYWLSATRVLQDYNGQMPFAIFLKQYLKQHLPQAGSRDRKIIARLCWQFFRLGQYEKSMPVNERLVLAANQWPTQNQEFLLLPEVQTLLNTNTHLYQARPSSAQIFPYAHLLSPAVDASEFGTSFLVQPDVFIRIRPQRQKPVLQKLSEAGVTFTQINETCLKLPATTPIDAILRIDEEAVIQDLNSQQTGTLIAHWATRTLDLPRLSLWDCCAASGGKSIMLTDLLKPLQHIVSDNRKSILHNLEQRFKQAQIKKPFIIHHNLTQPIPASLVSPIDLLVADVPCTGSGTWARTPEQLYYFNPHQLAAVVHQQESILKNALPHLKKGGLLAYITCSAFAAENEEMVQNFIKQFSLKLLDQQLLAGYKQQADSLFIAILQK